MPQPLTDLDAATCRRLRGVVFDIDDTVTRDGRLEPEAYAAICALADAGLLLAAVTGRPMGWADFVAWTWPVAVAVGENGAGWVWRRGAELCEGSLVRADAEQAAALARIRRRVAERLPEVEVAGDQRLRRYDLAFDIGERVRLPQATIAELVRLIEESGARATVSSVHCHVMVGSWDKFTGCRRALGDLGVDFDEEIERWLFIGDSGNDAADFAGFPRRVGVANVAEAVAWLPVPPRYVTAADRGRGFAEMAEHLLRARSAILRCARRERR